MSFYGSFSDMFAQSILYLSHNSRPSQAAMARGIANKIAG
jgi:hypothetical protein